MRRNSNFSVPKISLEQPRPLTRIVLVGFSAAAAAAVVTDPACPQSLEHLLCGHLQKVCRARALPSFSTLRRKARRCERPPGVSIAPRALSSALRGDPQPRVLRPGPRRSWGSSRSIRGDAGCRRRRRVRGKRWKKAEEGLEPHGGSGLAR